MGRARIIVPTSCRGTRKDSFCTDRWLAAKLGVRPQALSVATRDDNPNAPPPSEIQCGTRDFVYSGIADRRKAFERVSRLNEMPALSARRDVSGKPPVSCRRGAGGECCARLERWATIARMGRLFAFGIACVLGSLGLFAAYVLARPFLRPARAFRTAALFIAGAVGGTVSGFFVAVSLVGVSSEFTHTWLGDDPERPGPRARAPRGANLGS
jgi:hypothetical protein